MQMCMFIILSLSCLALDVPEVGLGALQDAISQSMPQGTTLEQCVADYKKDGWQCTAALASAAANFSGDKEELWETNRDVLGFLSHCQGVYLKKARVLLQKCKPLSFWMLNSNMPVISAIKRVKAVCDKVICVSRFPQHDWWGGQDETSMEAFHAGLLQLDSCRVDGQWSVEGLELLPSCNMDDIWEELLLAVSMRGSSGDFYQISDTVTFMEKRHVSRESIALFCLRYADIVCLSDLRSFEPSNREGHQGSTFRKFYDGEDIAFFMQDLFACMQAPHIGEERPKTNYILQYLRFLSWGNKGDFWCSFRSLQKCEELEPSNSIVSSFVQDAWDYLVGGVFANPSSYTQKTHLKRCIQAHKKEEFMPSSTFVKELQNLDLTQEEEFLQKDRELYDFLKSFQDQVFSRAVACLEAFAPLSHWVRKVNLPVCRAVLSMYTCVREWQHRLGEGADPWSDQPQMQTVKTLNAALVHLGSYYASHASDKWAHVTLDLMPPCDISAIWEEISLQAWNAGLSGDFAAVKETVSFMEQKGVKASTIALLCMRYADLVRIHNLPKFVVKYTVGDYHTTFYKFYNGENIDCFIGRLLEAAKDRRVHDTKELVLNYMLFLQWKGGLNWWSFFRALQKCEENLSFEDANHKRVQHCLAQVWGQLVGTLDEDPSDQTPGTFIKRVTRKGVAFESSPLLLNVAVDLPKDEVAGLLQTEAELCKFLMRFQQQFLDQAEQALEAFAPISKFMLSYDSPECRAVISLYHKVLKLSPRQGLSWDRVATNDDLESVVGALLQVEKVANSSEKGAFYLPGSMEGCGMDGIWEEFLDTSLSGTLCDFSDLVCLMERRRVSAAKIARYCLRHAVNIAQKSNRGFLANVGYVYPDRWRKMDKNDTVYCFFYGKNIAEFIQLLITSHGSDTEETRRNLLDYQQYLTWKGQVNWWEFIDGLLCNGFSYNDNPEVFAPVCSLLKREGSTLENALDHLCFLGGLEVDGQTKHEAIESLLIWLGDSHEGISAIWKRGGRVRNVTKLHLEALISRVDTLSECKSERFYNCVVQSVPSRGMFQSRVDTRDLPEGLYKRVIQGEGAIRFIADMLDAGGQSGERGRSERNAQAYLKYLSPQLSAEDLLGMLAQVPDHVNDCSFVSGLIWIEIAQKRGVKESSLLSYLQFLIGHASLDWSYAEKEIQQVCGYLRAFGDARFTLSNLGIGANYLSADQVKRAQVAEQELGSSARILEGYDVL